MPNESNCTLCDSELDHTKQLLFGSSYNTHIYLCGKCFQLVGKNVSYNYDTNVNTYTFNFVCKDRNLIKTCKKHKRVCGTCISDNLYDFRRRIRLALVS